MRRSQHTHKLGTSAQRSEEAHFNQLTSRPSSRNESAQHARSGDCKPSTAKVRTRHRVPGPQG
eukprot:3141522-Rhodomonas_salina.2